MTSSEILYLFLIVLPTIYSVTADPICKASDSDPSHVICDPGKEDYVLKRGLVSDNNLTTKVTLRSCRITYVDTDAFQGMPSIGDIDLSDNKITTLNLGVFDNTVQLYRVNLSINLLTDLPTNLFNQNPNLYAIDFKGNKLETVRVCVSIALPNLRYLNLSSNAFVRRSLDSNNFQTCRAIKYLDFSGNQMSYLDETLLSGLQEVEELNLEKCMLRDLPLFATRNNLRTMKKLLLSNNHITSLNYTLAFIYMENLEYLSLGWNEISIIHENVFMPMKKLNTLILRSNRLKRLPNTLFHNMRELKTIDLSSNLIKLVPVNAFRGTSLRNLNLSNNRFTYLTDNFCLELKNSGARLNKFYFNQNPWQCKCLLDVINEVDKMNISYNRVKYDGAEPVCVSDEFVCKRQANLNDVYVDLYDKLVLKLQ